MIYKIHDLYQTEKTLYAIIYILKCFFSLSKQMQYSSISFGFHEAHQISVIYFWIGKRALFYNCYFIPLTLLYAQNSC